jgi:GH15 family glucan-1,4-alpha-glucosidase
VRGPRRDFVHSKVMAWVAVDRAVEGAVRLGLPGPLDRWRSLRATIHDEVCAKGFDSDRGTFTQYYGSRTLDAALLQIAPVGFLPPRDPRVRGTVAAIENELVQEGFVMRYDTRGGDVDALPPGEGAFLPCTFWLADNHALAGDLDRATEVYERLLGLRNDVGLLTEEYDVGAGRLVGNLPQAFSHVPLVSTAYTLQAAGRGASRRRAGSSHPGSEQ